MSDSRNEGGTRLDCKDNNEGPKDQEIIIGSRATPQLTN